MSLKLPESLKLKPPTKAARKPLSGANQLARRELSEAAMVLRTAVTILCKRLPYCQGVLEKKGKQYTEQAKALQLDVEELSSLASALNEAIEQHKPEAPKDGKEETPDVPD